MWCASSFYMKITTKWRACKCLGGLSVEDRPSHWGTGRVGIGQITSQGANHEYLLLYVTIPRSQDNSHVLDLFCFGENIPYHFQYFSPLCSPIECVKWVKSLTTIPWWTEDLIKIQKWPSVVFFSTRRPWKALVMHAINYLAKHIFCYSKPFLCL